MANFKTIKTLTEFIKWAQEVGGRNVLYRGLASDEHDYKLSASLHRRMARSEEKTIQQSRFARASRELVNQAKMEGHDREIGEQATDLDILAQLQHYGAATCLIDFTKNPLVALWFACQSPNNKNGKSVAINTADASKYSIIGIDDIKKPIEELMNGETLWKWSPKKQNNRIVAQQSVFVFGVPGIADDNITSSCVISDKQEILAELETQGISAESLFCDFDGFAREINGHNKPYREQKAEDYFSFGVHYQQRGEFKKAIDNYDPAIEIDPQYADAYYNRGVAKANLGDNHGALADYNKAFEIWGKP